MKRVGALYPVIAEEENLLVAFRKAARGKQDRPEVRAFSENLDTNIHELQRQFLQKDVRVGDYRFFRVHDPKERSICAAAFPERVVHHAIMNVCEPILDAYSIFDSYACRKGKGSRKAVLRCQEYARRFEWFLKFDIRRYFDAIRHSLVAMQLERRFKDKDLLELFKRILTTYHTAPGQGLPIGNLISQHLANFYLGPFDHWIKEVEGISGYVRYMDDCILWADDRQRLRGELGRLSAWLADTLKLGLKGDVQLNRCRRGIDFLGYRVFPDRILLSRRSKNRFARRLRACEARWRKGIWGEAQLCRHVEPLVAFTRGASAHGFRAAVMERIGVSS